MDDLFDFAALALTINADDDPLDFIIVMPPLSNAAWLSAALTTDWSVCFCEPLSNGRYAWNVDALSTDRITGIADSSIGDSVELLNNHTAREVVVRRSADDVIADFARLFAIAPDAVPENIRMHQVELASQHDQIRADLVVEFDQLSDRLPDVWRVCTGLPYDARRVEFLRQFRIDPASIASPNLFAAKPIPAGAH
jgi:hypothetical protein